MLCHRLGYRAVGVSWSQYTAHLTALYLWTMSEGWSSGTKDTVKKIPLLTVSTAPAALCELHYCVLLLAYTLALRRLQVL